MKKINSIDYGGKIIGVGLIFAFAVPILLWLLNRAIKSSIVIIAIKASIALGALILLGFFIHLAVELHQDRKIDQYYSTHRNIKIMTKTGIYECGECGNRAVKENDTHCFVCGVHFVDCEDKAPQEIIKTER